ncbi:membrane protein [Pilimelia terevasa]|uniref:Membrane protein n=1 Tax=Pilimelia terevasa TaxID=53372 RepID=A0A8J3BLC7_9ACTN|nr:membrane protein [Pilimelia terevasa]
MARLLLLLTVVEIGLAIAALISCLSTDEGRVRVLPRIGWVIVILLFPIVGGVAWFAAGRDRAPRPPAPRRPLAPDDDPDFLRSLRERPDDDPPRRP